MTDLSGKSALVVGAGGLGSPVALALAAAGVGRIGLIDDDAVDLSNLQRQILHGTSDVGRPKIETAREVLGARVETFLGRVVPDIAVDLFRRFDVVCDGSDNFGTRFLCNDAAILARTPLVHAGVLRFAGQVMTVLPGRSSCYRCLFEGPPPEGLVLSCAEAGVLGAVAGLTGALQAAEAIRILGGRIPALAGRLLRVDMLADKARTIDIPRDPDCSACGQNALTELAIERYAAPECPGRVWPGSAAAAGRNA